jgi:hypothetical protein
VGDLAVRIGVGVFVRFGLVDEIEVVFGESRGPVFFELEGALFGRRDGVGR